MMGFVCYSNQQHFGLDFRPFLATCLYVEAVLLVMLCISPPFYFDLQWRRFYTRLFTFVVLAKHSDFWLTY